MACFSFYPGKNLGAYGDAGAIVTIATISRQSAHVCHHGRIDKYNHEQEGVNSRMTFAGRYSEHQVKHLEDWTEKRRPQRLPL